MVEQPWCTSEQSILPRITEAEVKPEDVKPRGMTALFDAMYNACNNISEMEKNNALVRVLRSDAHRVGSTSQCDLVPAGAAPPTNCCRDLA